MNGELLISVMPAIIDVELNVDAERVMFINVVGDAAIIHGCYRVIIITSTIFITSL